MENRTDLNNINGGLKKSEKKLIMLLTLQLCLFERGELGIQEQIKSLELIGKAAEQLVNLFQATQAELEEEITKCEQVCEAIKEATSSLIQ